MDTSSLHLPLLVFIQALFSMSNMENLVYFSYVFNLIKYFQNIAKKTLSSSRRGSHFYLSVKIIWEPLKKSYCHLGSSIDNRNQNQEGGIRGPVTNIFYEIHEWIQMCSRDTK